MKKINVKMLALIPMFTALSIVGAFLRIDIQPVPVTFQLFFCVCAGLFLGSKYGALSQILYALIGLIGLPVFSGSIPGGFGVLLSPTFGYILGFPFAAFLCGWMREKWEKQRPDLPIWALLLCSLSALAVDYIFGIGYLYFIFNAYRDGMSFVGALAAGTGLFLYKDIILCVVLGLVSKSLLKTLKLASR